MTYSMACSCGHEMKVDADSREAAVAKMQGMMTQAELDKHMAKYHKEDEPEPTLKQVHAQISANLKEAVAVA